MDEKTVKEKFSLIEKELETLTRRVEEVSALQRELDDLKFDIKALKLFLGRTHPEFKGQFPEILQKLKV